MAYRECFYPESKFGGFADVDGAVIFYARVRQLAKPGDIVVDFGCGRGAWLEDTVGIRRELRFLKGRVERVIGLDIDPVGKTNPAIDEFRQLCGYQWPMESDSVDLVICDSVLEHLEEPAAFFAEAHRVLKPEGTLCLRTSNVLSYTGLATRLVPERFHARLLQRVQPLAPKEQDVFPKHFRCNTVGKLRRAMKRHGFDAVVYGFDSDPQYLEFSKVAYFLGVLHQKYAPRVFAPAIFAFGRKFAQAP